MSSINFRVFRRNTKNLILLWNGAQLSDEQKDWTAFVVAPDGIGDDRPIDLTRFHPDNPEKFAQDVDGIVIPHAQNHIDPALPCTIKVIFGEDSDEPLEMVKEVMPANSVETVRPRLDSKVAVKMHLYAMDYETKAWVPWPKDGVIPENIQIGLKPEA